MPDSEAVNIGCKGLIAKVAEKFCKLLAVGSIPTESTLGGIMKPVLEFPEIIAWAGLTAITCGMAFPFFIGRVIYVMVKKDSK